MVHKLITIVIPCKNEENYIGKTLSSISRQRGIESTRVIIADANSTDRTIEVISECQKELHNLRIEVIAGGPVSIGRNRGAELVKTPYVLFMDADTELIEDDILALSVNNLDDYKLITCKVKSSAKTIKSKVIFRSFNLLRRYLMKRPFCTGIFFLTSIEDFNRFGKFDETVTNSEDYLLSRLYQMRDFCILERHATQDDRRFKKMGYFSFLKMMLMNYMNRNSIEYFRRDINYWQ